MTDEAKTTAPRLVYEPLPCPRCGARTADEAGELCRPSFDETGEASCPGDSQLPDGTITQPTAESIAALDAWIDALPIDGSIWPLALDPAP